MDNDTICKECSESFNDSEQVRRHLRKHGMTFELYTLKWVYNNVRPTCKCGCGKNTLWNVALKGYATYVKGHSSYGRKKSDEEKAKIGHANSINMKRWMHEHPDVAKLRNEQMLCAHTSELEQRRIEATRKTYASMSEEEKQAFRERAIKRWETGELREAKVRATETFRKRSSAGEYDFTERNKKLSETISKKYVDGTWKFSKGTYTSSKSLQPAYYRSSWELQYMKELDADMNVVSWESEFVSLPYMFEGKNHRYIPDFHVVRKGDRHELVEIKPITLRNTPRNIAKRAAAERYCAERGWAYVEWQMRTCVST